MRRVLFVLFTVFAALGCGTTQTYDYKKEPDPRWTEFRLGPLDQLSIVVWKNKDLSADVTVRPDGIITLPLIGDVRAGGKTPSEVQKDIHQRYTAFVRDEEVVVSVSVTSVNSYYFTVSGNVEHTGLYSSKAWVSAVEAIAMAGGPTRFASDTIYIVRGEPSRRIPIELSKAMSGAHPEQNIAVLRGDVLYVP